MTEPSLSIVMPVRNAGPFVDAALRSLLAQSHEDFELIVRDDLSTDDTWERLDAWAKRDPRIRLFRGDERLGPAGSSNWVVEHARAPLVARMDADDISHPDRLRRQHTLLDRYPDAVLVGSVWEGIDREGRVVRPPDLLALCAGRFSAPFAHGSIMFRREAFMRAGGYRRACDYWEDQDLYLRLADLGRILVIGEPLYRHRYSEASTRLSSERLAVERAVDLMFRCREAHRRGRDHAAILSRGPLAEGARLHPHCFVSLGFLALWSGGRPQVLGPLLRRGRLRPDRVTVTALVWAVWAAISPASLRAVTGTLLRRRNRRALDTLPALEAHEWRPRRPAPAAPVAAPSLDRSLPVAAK